MRMRAVRIIGLFVAALAGAAQLASGQTASTQDEERDTRGSDSDPTRPVFLSIRPEYSAIGEAVSEFQLIFRYDAALLRARRFSAILRLELPVTGAHAGAQSAGGIGDVYGQILVPWFLTRRFAFAMGAGVVVPTADSPLLGGGKWTVAPVVAPVWRFPHGMFFVKLQQFTSTAGDASRPDLSSFLVTPTFIHTIARAWWVIADSETRTDWRLDGRTGIKTGFQVGRAMVPGVAVWIKPELWWGPNRDGHWNLKFGLVWYARRAQP